MAQAPVTAADAARGPDGPAETAARPDLPPSRIEALTGPYGVVAGLRRSPVPRGLSDFCVSIADIGGGAPGYSPAGVEGIGGNGCGRALDDPERARLIAIAEAAERYAAGDFLGEHVVWASVAELDGPVLDPARIARCSPREYETPGCPVRPFDPDASIRWTQGVDLATGERVWVPAIMACYMLRDARPQEGFVCRISTGNAVHTTLTEALVQGIGEVVERDAIAVAWLQKLPLPLIPDAATASSPTVARLLAWGERHFVSTFFFDATTDVGLPTVICVQVADRDDKAHQTLGCGTGRTSTEAAERAILEALSTRNLHTLTSPIPDSPALFTVEHSVRYMGAVERAEAFAFLLDGARERPRRACAPWPADPAAMLDRLVSALTGLGMQAIAVERTTRELAAVGLVAVNVLIPDLQPLSLSPLAQFRAHPRLAALPAALGHPSLPEEEQNWWPQPLA